MIEVVAAAVGVALGASFQGLGSANRRYAEGREAVVRLTSAVENLALRFEELHEDIKADRSQYLIRLSELENRITRLEALQ